MSREILFKAKQIDTEEWIEGYLFATQKRIYIAYPDQFDDDLFLATDCIFLTVDRKTVCQYTGMKDKNGRKIFEGDIVEKLDISGYSPEISTHCIQYSEKHNAFSVDGNIPLQKHINLDMCEVIGNVFDNPELLEGQVNNE